MANCPNCNKRLHIWNLKAECPHCKANIPNHNWEGRLEEDAVIREKAFYKMHSNLHMLKFSVLGNIIRILRFAFAFLPIIGYLIPLGTVFFDVSRKETIYTNKISVLSLFIDSEFKIGNVISVIKANISTGNGKFALYSFGAFLLSLVFGVIAFFLIPILFNHPKQPVSLRAHVVSIGLYASFPVLAQKLFDNSDLVVGSTTNLVYIGVVLFAISIIFDIIVLIKKVDPLEGKYIPDANKDELQAEYAKSIGEPFKEKVAKTEESEKEAE